MTSVSDPRRLPTVARAAGLTRIAVAALLAAALPVPSAAQSANGGGEPDARVAVATRASVAPEVDGVLGEAAWREATELTGFVQRQPYDGEPASERTAVRILFDDEALYVGAWMYDADPSAIVDGEAIRDANLNESDAVELIFDTFRDEQNGFVFGTNPAGVEYDGQVANEGEGGGFFLGGGGGGFNRQQAGAGGGFNKNWDASWRVATSRDDAGWYAEFRIPFSTLRYAPSDEPLWGLNVARRIRRRNEEAYWSPVPRQFSLHRLTYAGVLEGLRPPVQRLAQVTPYVLGSTARDYAAGEDDFGTDAEWGADAKVQLTGGLTMDLTYNTDFAQVEVDEAQVNLTRFSLFFPEKRPFFLENAGFFNVGGGGAELFFSRTIGIAAGRQVPIQGGGRVSGRVAGLNVGLLHIETEGLDGVVSGNAYSVARVAKELPNRSRIGGIVMRRDAADVDGDWNHTYGVDGQLGLGEAWTLSSWGAATRTPGLDGREHAFDAQLGHTSRNWRGTLQYREVGEDFNPELGFLPRAGYRYYQTMVMNYIRPESIGWLREARPHVSYFTYRNIESGFEETSRLHVDSHFDSPTGWHFSPAFNWNREGLEEPFEISDGVVVAPGTYDGWEAGWRFNSNLSAPFSFSGSLDWGSFLSGTRRGVGGTITYRSGARFTTSLRLDHNDVELDEGSFTARLASLRFGYFFTPRIYLQSLVQYSDQIDTWSANVRFGWLNTAGTGLFVVYNEAQGFDALSGPQARGLIVKFTRQFDVARW